MCKNQHSSEQYTPSNTPIMTVSHPEHTRVVLGDITAGRSNRLPSRKQKLRRRPPPPVVVDLTEKLRPQEVTSDADIDVDALQQTNPVYRARYEEVSKAITECISDFANFDTLGDLLDDDDGDGETLKDDTDSHHSSVRAEGPLLPIDDDESRDTIQRANAKYHGLWTSPSDETNLEPIMEAEYSEDIFRYMNRIESRYKPKKEYMDIQPSLDWAYRSAVVEWLVQMHEALDLIPETLFLAVNIMDRYLSKTVITLNKFRLVGISALFIAAKMEELHAPSLEELLDALDGQYAEDEIVVAERTMLLTLKFKLGWPGPFSFLRKSSRADEYNVDIRAHAKYFMEVMILDGRSVAAPPSWFAAAAYFIAKVMVLGDDSWTLKHVFFSGYTNEQLLPLVRRTLDACDNSKQNHKVLREKYKSEEHSCTIQEYEKWRANTTYNP